MAESKDRPVLAFICLILAVFACIGIFWLIGEMEESRIERIVETRVEKRLEEEKAKQKEVKAEPEKEEGDSLEWKPIVEEGAKPLPLQASPEDLTIESLD
jgi:hypothetical protein